MTDGFVSYAQNFEDVMLWRALKHVDKGFYIDVGAHSPSESSVTLAFYERGWRGINIEPHPGYHRELVAARPRDINLDVAAGDRPGVAELFVVGETGLSTLVKAEARRRTQEGWHVSPVQVRVETLDSIWTARVPPGQPVHFLKADVEGFEREVLLGNDWRSHRPWIVVIEATQPTTAISSHQEWESILTAAAYSLVYRDGLNRFYLAEEHGELAPAFEYPPNFFDGFVGASEVAARERAGRAEERAAAAEAELEGIKATRSWRWTAPMRAGFATARSVRRSLRRRATDAAVDRGSSSAGGSRRASDDTNGVAD